MLSFTSSDPILQDGFAWAQAQALSYARHGEDPVGLWYDAALPGRDAFCVRDASHQRAGAAVLGLQAHTYNMFRKLAGSMHEARDFCMFWEIDKRDRPAPVDYTDDRDFWYNLPANFDLMQACRAEALWTGDSRYIEEPCFARLEALSFGEYIARWDRDGDGIPDHRPEDGCRGIASYNEVKKSPRVAGDLLGAMFAAYRAAGLEDKARALQKLYLEDWYDAKRGRFYGAKDKRGRFVEKYCREGNFLPIYFGLLDGTPYLRGALEDVCLHGPANVEAKTYFPQLYYGRGFEEDGLRELRGLCDPRLKRREYPEVSFAAAGALVNQYLGLAVPAPGLLRTLSGVPEGGLAAAEGVPVLGTEVSLRQEGQRGTTLRLAGERAARWRACFLGEYSELICNGENRPALHAQDAAGRTVSYIELDLPVGEEVTVTARIRSSHWPGNSARSQGSA